MTIEAPAYHWRTCPYELEECQLLGNSANRGGVFWAPNFGAHRHNHDRCVRMVLSYRKHAIVTGTAPPLLDVSWHPKDSPLTFHFCPGESP